jgi:hypothetical protein
MRSLLLSSLALLAAACLAQAAPRITIAEAASIAQNELKSRGLESQIYVIGIALETDGMANAEKYWHVRWSDAIAGEERKKEVGVKVKMDGSIVRLVEGSEGVEALRNHRTRSDRPSVLDLKH